MIERQPHAGAAGTLTLGGDLTVNRLGYGAMQLAGRGVWGDPKDREGACRLLRRAVELNVNFIDTADAYGPETNERLIADALHPYPPGLVIATKGGLTRPAPDEWHRKATPAHLGQACEASLRRLRVERIDLYQLHSPDPRVPIEDSMAEIVRLQREGKIRHIGVSNFSVADLRRAQRVANIVSVQNRYNVGDRGSDDVLRFCEQQQIAFIPWYPLASGDHAGSRRPVADLRRIMDEHRATVAQAAIAWLLARSPAMLPIPGTSSIAHLEENIAAARMVAH